MRNLIGTSAAVGFLAILFAGVAIAAPGVIRTKDGTTHEAFHITGKTVSGIAWEVERGRPGVRVNLWDLESVRFRGQDMDEYNSLPRRLSAGLGSRLVQDATVVMSMERARGFTEADWRAVTLACRYFIAQGYRLQQNYERAVQAFEEYLNQAEQNTFEAGAYRNVNYTSPFSNRPVSNAGGLHRYYLDALEGLGDSYLRLGDVESANKKAFEPLQELTDQLAARSANREYIEWALRALRASALFAEDNKDWTAAMNAYERLQSVAIRRDGGRTSRESSEAGLKVGYMQVKAGQARTASATFSGAIRAWEQRHVRVVDRMREPANGWADPDDAFLAAGSYVGQGMVEAAGARNSSDWARSLRNYSMALSIFHSGREIRSLALLGAAEAAAKLAELSNRDERMADNYALLAEKYLHELRTLMPNSRAAADESIPDIEALIEAHKRRR
jgi:hypothetical protein